MRPVSPRDPLLPVFILLRAFCHLWVGDAETAEAMARLAVSLSPKFPWSRLALAVACSSQGRAPEAMQAVEAARQIDPTLSIASFNAAVGKVPETFRDEVYAMLREAGLPEGSTDA